MVREAAPRISIIGSGGIRSGIDVAKVIALGAQAAGIAVPLLEPATVGVDDVVGVLEEIIDELRIAMFCIGADDLEALRGTPLLQRID